LTVSESRSVALYNISFLLRYGVRPIWEISHSKMEGGGLVMQRFYQNEFIWGFPECTNPVFTRFFLPPILRNILAFLWRRKRNEVFLLSARNREFLFCEVSRRRAALYGLYEWAL
jgi:hypothetical protein